MHNKKFLKFVSSFDDNEIKKFRDFLESPFFNRSRKVVKLYNYIIQFHPGFNTDGLSEKIIHKNLFPNAKFNSSTIRHLFTDLLKLGERFLIQINLTRRKNETDDFLLDELSMRNQHNLLLAHINQLESELSIEDYAGGEHFLNKFKLETERFNFEMTNPPGNSKKLPQSVISSITSRNKYLVSFFVVEIIKGIDALNLLSHKFEFKTQNNFTGNFLNILDINKLVLFLKNHPELTDYSHIFEIYYKLFQAFTNIDYEAFYFEYKEAVKKYKSKLSKSELIYLHKKLIDYCILKGKIRRSQANFEEELFNVYENIIMNGYYINSNDDFIPVSLFRNIIILALRLKKFSWAEDFVKYKHIELPPPVQKNIYNYSSAMICFEKKEFEKVLEFLNKIKLDNFDMKIDVKNLQIKVYYKLNYLEEAMYSIQSYKEFLRSSPAVSESRKKSHNNFLLFAKSLLRLKAKPDDTFCEFTRNRLINTIEIVSKPWLLECIDEIKKEINSDQKQEKKKKLSF